MRKLNTLLSVMALSMSAALFTSCGNNNQPKPQGEKEVTYEKYRRDLEGKSRENFPYELALVNGEVNFYDEDPEADAVFQDVKVRFYDGNPRARPQESEDLAEYAMNNLMGFASYWSQEDVKACYINKSDNNTYYKVVSIEPVAEGLVADFTYTYDKQGLPTSVISGEPYSIAGGSLRHRAIDYSPLKELRFEYQAKDKIGSFERISYEEFHAKAVEHETAECSYQSGRVNGTYRQLGTGNTVTLDNEILTKGSYFEDPLRREDLYEVFLRRLSNVPDYDYYYFYYSQTEHALMYYEEISNEYSYIERVWTFNQYGLIISVQDELKGPEAFPFKAYEYHLTMTYSNDQATITVTLLAGLGKFNGNVDRLTVTAQYGAYLGNVVSSTATPTAEGYSIYGSHLAKTTGELVNYGEQLFSDITLIYPFYKNESSTFIQVKARPNLELKFKLSGFDSTTPVLCTDTSGNGMYYMPSNETHVFDYIFAADTGVDVTRNFNLWGANLVLSDNNGPLARGNNKVFYIALSPSVTKIQDYAYKDLIGITNISHGGSGSLRLEIGNYAFYNCSIQKLNVNPRVVKIGDYAFALSGLSGIVTWLGYAEEIGHAAFDECDDLVGLFIQPTLTYNETYQWNRFSKPTLPAGFAEDWNGNADILYQLSIYDFKHNETVIDVTATIGHKETLMFGLYLATGTYQATITAANSGVDSIQILDINDNNIGTVSGTDIPNYKTINNITGGNFYIVKVVGVPAENLGQVLFQFINVTE